MAALDYIAHNTAQRIVALSLTNPGCTWALIISGLDGTVHPTKQGVYVFADGSQLTFTASGLPVKFIG